MRTRAARGTEVVVMMNPLKRRRHLDDAALAELWTAAALGEVYCEHLFRLAQERVSRIRGKLQAVVAHQGRHHRSIITAR